MEWLGLFLAVIITGWIVLWICACVVKFMMAWCSFFFFFQAEDGIRDTSVTGVQTCALPISRSSARRNFACNFPAAHAGPRAARRARRVARGPRLHHAARAARGALGKRRAGHRLHGNRLVAWEAALAKCQGSPPRAREGPGTRHPRFECPLLPDQSTARISHRLGGHRGSVVPEGGEVGR